MKSLILISLALLAALLTIPTLRAQSGGSYELSWSTFAGSGGLSSGGAYAISGTIGQPDAGTMSGGNYSLAGGFWGALQTPGAPLLSITRSNATVIVSWTLPAPGWVLDQTAALTGTPPPWTPVPFPYVTNATTIGITVTAPSGTRFYRLRHP